MFVRAKSGCDKWHDYEMSVAPYETGKPIYYEFTACPAAEFAIRHGLTDIMPALCNVDFASMELLHARLIPVSYTHLDVYKRQVWSTPTTWAKA